MSTVNQLKFPAALVTVWSDMTVMSPMWLIFNKERLAPSVFLHPELLAKTIHSLCIYAEPFLRVCGSVDFCCRRGLWWQSIAFQNSPVEIFLSGQNVLFYIFISFFFILWWLKWLLKIIKTSNSMSLVLTVVLKGRLMKFFFSYIEYHSNVLFYFSQSVTPWLSQVGFLFSVVYESYTDLRLTNYGVFGRWVKWDFSTSRTSQVQFYVFLKKKKQNN